MNILEAYDLTGSLRDAAELAGCSHHTVARYVAERERGRAVPGAAARRPGVIDEFLPKLEELVERSKGKIRADVAHEKITAMGYAGSERTTRRSVAGLKQAYAAGRRRVHRPWVAEPGMWAQYDFGDGPRIGGAATVVPYRRASKGGSESTVKIAKADLVPTGANLLAAYASFADLEAACAGFCVQVNARPHRITRRAPAEMLAEERSRLHPVPAAPFTAALGVTRKVDALSLVAFEGGQYSVPHELAGQAV